MSPIKCVRGQMLTLHVAIPNNLSRDFHRLMLYVLDGLAVLQSSSDLIPEK
jgi:hypothetical protein